MVARKTTTAGSGENTRFQEPVQPEDAAVYPPPSGSQTLLRGLDIIELVANGSIGLVKLSEALGLTRSTTYRLATALVDRRYLTFIPREGYMLGPKLLELGARTQQQMSILQIARPHLIQLANLTEDTVHLGVIDENWALYLEKISGRRRVEIGSRVGERQPLSSTGLGKALILDEGEMRWREIHAVNAAEARKNRTGVEDWIQSMRNYARLGYAFDLEENEDRIRCIAAPIRDASGRIVASISLSSAAQYMDDARMANLSGTVREVAAAISRDIGWTDGPNRPAR